MNRMQNMLLTVSWLTIASAGFVAGQSPATAQRPAQTDTSRIARDQAAARKLASCAPIALPDPTLPTRQPPQGTCRSCHAVDGAVPPRPVNVPSPSVQPGHGVLQGAHDAALRSIQILTRENGSWTDRYLAAEAQNPMGTTLEGRLFLRLDAIEKIAASQHP
jgi:hypothetical protein